MIEEIILGGAALIAIHKTHCNGFKNSKTMKLFKISNQLPANWYDETDRVIDCATTEEELNKLKDMLWAQYKQYWITNKEKAATLYLITKAGLRARLIRTGTRRITIKEFNR